MRWASLAPRFSPTEAADPLIRCDRTSRLSISSRVPPPSSARYVSVRLSRVISVSSMKIERYFAGISVSSSKPSNTLASRAADFDAAAGFDAVATALSTRRPPAGEPRRRSRRRRPSRESRLPPRPGLRSRRIARRPAPVRRRPGSSDRVPRRPLAAAARCLRSRLRTRPVRRRDPSARRPGRPGGRRPGTSARRRRR